MQRKYNMALQHFYEAATHSATDEDELKSKLRDLSGSEEDVFNIIDSKQGNESKESNTNNGEENNYFTYESSMSVKRIKPVSICSWRGSTLLCIWCILFILGVLSISYCLQIAINRIPDKGKTYIARIKPNTSHTDIENDDKVHNYSEPCSDFKIQHVWSDTSRKFQASSPMRLLDVDKDGVEDVLYGFSTSLGDGPYTNKYKDINKAKHTCKKYFNGTYPCFGGVVALNGVSGERLWVHYTNHAITSIVCNGDLDDDGYADCLCSGHGDMFEALSGKTGRSIWVFHDTHEGYKSRVRYDFAQPQFVNDLNGDGVLDVLQFHGGHHTSHKPRKSGLMAKALFVSGRTGSLLKSHSLASRQDSHSSPVVYLGENNVAMVVYGTGDENQGGDLIVIRLHDLYTGMLNQSTKILSSNKKGYVNPPNLVDVNGDGTVDIISAGFGDKIQAIDGKDFKILWTHHSSGTETYSSPALGYYNNDDTVDFMVRINTGSGSPVYYDSKMLILDGKTGLPLEKALKTSVPTHTSPLSVSMEGVGNDLFLYWVTDCVDHQHEGGWYNFVEGTDADASFRADSCYGRFGVNSFTTLNVMNKRIGFPGKPVYVSDVLNKHSTEEVMTGAVVPSLGKIKQNSKLVNTFDVVFVTSSIIPAKVRTLTPQDIDCIKDNTAKVKPDDVPNRRKGIYDDGDAVTNYCLSKRLPKEVYTNPKKQTNFNKGQLTVHRYQLTCLCEEHKDSVRVLPDQEQGWSQYMGSLSNGYFNRRPTGRLNRSQ